MLRDRANDLYFQDLHEPHYPHEEYGLDRHNIAYRGYKKGWITLLRWGYRNPLMSSCSFSLSLPPPLFPFISLCLSPFLHSSHPLRKAICHVEPPCGKPFVWATEGCLWPIAIKELNPANIDVCEQRWSRQTCRWEPCLTPWWQPRDRMGL